MAPDDLGKDFGKVQHGGNVVNRFGKNLPGAGTGIKAISFQVHLHHGGDKLRPPVGSAKAISTDVAPITVTVRHSIRAARMIELVDLEIELSAQRGLLG